jgi:hypothetical protein
MSRLNDINGLAEKCKTDFRLLLIYFSGLAREIHRRFNHNEITDFKFQLPKSKIEA